MNKDERELEKFIKFVIRSGDYSLLGEDGFMFYKRIMKFHKLTQKQADIEFAKEKVEKEELKIKINRIVEEAGIDPKKVPVKWLKENLSDREWEIFYILEKGI